MLELLSPLMFAKNINTFMKTLILTLEHHMSVELATFIVVFMQKKKYGFKLVWTLVMGITPFIYLSCNMPKLIVFTS
jgi:hypothetical protein